MARTKKAVEEEIVEDPFDYKGIIILAISGLLIFFAITKQGTVGTIINNILSCLFGPWYIALLIIAFIMAILLIFFKSKYKFSAWFYIGLMILSAVIMIFSAYLVYKDSASITIATLGEVFKDIKNIASNTANFGGGLIGTLFLYLLTKAFSLTGVVITIVVLFFLSLILIIPVGMQKRIVSNVTATGIKVKEKIDVANEERRQLKEKQRQEYEQKLQEEKEKEDRLHQELADLYAGTSYNNEQLTIPDFETKKEDKDVEYVDNVSDFSKTYFLDDDKKEKETLTLPKKNSSASKISTTNTSNIQAPIKRKGIYHLPPLSLLANVSGKPSNINKNSAEVKGKKLIEILANFGIDAKLENTHIGPSVTKFEIKPDTNVKVSRIMNIQDNIKMELAAKTIRIEAPIPGRSAVGVEIPNAETVTVRMSELMKSVPDKYKNSSLMFTLGKDLMGQPVYCELNKMPHLLVAGATGSGKSVCMNTIITSYLLRTNPDDVKLVLVDPKKVEFTPYHDIPHLLWPVITDTNIASNMLKKLVVIMEERYDAFAEVGVRDIASFNELVRKHNANLKEDESPMNKMPFIVIIIDELADLMAVAKKDVELSIQRLTQLSRACGMHLIVATQRPSTDVITGLIKSNIPSRISFAVSSSIDSRTILDQVGAEKLLGYGDMLYLPQGESAPIRIQGCFVTDEEIKKITDYAKKQASPEYDDAYFEFLRAGNPSDTGSFGFVAQGGEASKDSLYDEVVEYVRETQKASTSLLQRKFGIGYNRAARIIDQLEENNIIGGANGSKPREVLIKKED